MSYFLAFLQHLPDDLDAGFFLDFWDVALLAVLETYKLILESPVEDFYSIHETLMSILVILFQMLHILLWKSPIEVLYGSLLLKSPLEDF